MPFLRPALRPSRAIRLPAPPPPPPIIPVLCLLFSLFSPPFSLSLSFRSAIRRHPHPRSRGYVVEPPRGHGIIIGWQVTRTLSPGFNWPIIVERIDAAAGPDRRETFGVACSPSDTTRTFCDEYLLAGRRVPTRARIGGAERGGEEGVAGRPRKSWT